MRRRLSAAVLLLLTAGLGSCGGPTPSATAPPIHSPAASPTPPTAGSPASAPAPSPAVEMSLLDALPAEILGVALTRDLETTTEIVAGGGLPSEVDALAVGVYVAPGSSTTDDFAIANVARLRSGVFTEGWFRAWRDSYDESACERSGGLAAGAAETEIGGRRVHIGSCQGGVHTYHVHLEDLGRVVSITALGERRLGERAVAGLTE